MKIFKVKTFGSGISIRCSAEDCGNCNIRFRCWTTNYLDYTEAYYYFEIDKSRLPAEDWAVKKLNLGNKYDTRGYFAVVKILELYLFGRVVNKFKSVSS